MERRTEFKVFCGNSNPTLAKEIGRFLRVSMGKLEANKFSNGETSVLIQESIRSQDVYIVQSTCANMNQINYIKHTRNNKTKSPNRRSMSRSNSGTNVSPNRGNNTTNTTNNSTSASNNAATTNTSITNTAITSNTTNSANTTNTDINALITTAVNTLLTTDSNTTTNTTSNKDATNITIVEDTFVVLTNSGSNEVINTPNTTNTPVSDNKNHGTPASTANTLPVPTLAPTSASVSIGTQTPTPPVSPLPIPIPAPTQTPSTPISHAASALLPPIPVTPPSSMRGPIPVTPPPATPTQALPQTPIQGTPLSTAALIPLTPFTATPPPATPTQAPPQTPKSPNPTSQISPSISPRMKPDVIISHSTSADADLHNWSVNDSLMELLVMGDAFKRASCRQLVAVIPFFGYARQSKKHTGRTPITAKLVANMLQTAGFDRVITVDLHASQIQGFFDIPVDNLYAEPSIVKYIRKRIQGDKVVVAPGVGGVKRAKSVADKLDLDLAILHKETNADTDEKYMVLVGDVKDKVALIIDDIADTCETLELATYSLVAKGAKEVYALVTHGVLSDRAIERLNSMPLKELVITNTIPNEYNLSQCPKLKVINLGHLLGEAIRRTNFGESLSTYFFT